MALAMPQEPVAETDAATGEGDLPPDIAPGKPLIELPPCDSAAVLELRERLGLHPLVAQTLVRRGITGVERVTAFLDDEELLDAVLLPGATAAAAVITGHLRAGTRIAVHGDYDVDGVCSTAILVRTLDRLGANVTWHVPSRFGEGYGLSRAAIDRLADDDAGLIVAVDCAITAVDEVEHAVARGVEVVICDHHTPGARLPDAAAIVHPGIGDYACPQLCAAAATFKLAQLVVREMGEAPATIDDELELVGLATVCDVVPLTGENRALVRVGLRAMRRTLRPGLRELMRVAAVDQLGVDAGSFGFRLGPRINAAGRMYSAEPAVELLLTTNEARAAELADQLGAANARRRDIEQSILFSAETQARAQRDRFAIVVAGEGWHPGVLGIVAGRIAERFRRPCVALSIEDGRAAGSGRSGGVYDLLAGLKACDEHLVRYGGHRAAAGLELDAAALPAFSRCLQEHAAAELTTEDLRPRVRVDAVADPSQLTLEAAEALERLGPFGAGNREPAVLVPAITVSAVRRMGDRGQHLRLSIDGRGGRAGVVAFGWESAVAHGDDAPLSNIVVRLGRNEFRGVVEAQSRLVALAELPPAGRDEHVQSTWRDRFFAAVAEPPPAAGAASGLEESNVADRCGDTPLAVLAELAADADHTAVVVNDPEAWRDRLRALEQIDDRFAALRVHAYGDSRLSGRTTAAPVHAVLAEPPFAPARAATGCERTTIAWNAADVRATAAAAQQQLLDRAHVVAAYRAVKDAPENSFAALEDDLRAAVPHPHTAAAAIHVLEELGHLKVMRNGPIVESIRVTGATRSELDSSSAYRAYSQLKEESRRWLAQLTENPPTAGS